MVGRLTLDQDDEGSNPSPRTKKEGEMMNVGDTHSITNSKSELDEDYYIEDHVITKIEKLGSFLHIECFDGLLEHYLLPELTLEAANGMCEEEHTLQCHVFQCQDLKIPEVAGPEDWPKEMRITLLENALEKYALKRDDFDNEETSKG